MLTPRVASTAWLLGCVAVLSYAQSSSSSSYTVADLFANTTVVFGPQDATPTASPLLISAPYNNFNASTVVSPRMFSFALAFRSTISGVNNTFTTQNVVCLTSVAGSCSIPQSIQTSVSEFSSLSLVGQYVLASSATDVVVLDTVSGNVAGSWSKNGNKGIAAGASRFGAVVFPQGTGASFGYQVVVLGGFAVQHNIAAPYTNVASSPFVNSRHFYAVVDNWIAQYAIANYSQTQQYTLTSGCLPAGDTFVSNVGLNIVATGNNVTSTILLIWGTTARSGFVMCSFPNPHAFSWGGTGSWRYQTSTAFAVHSVSSGGGVLLVNVRRTDILSSSVLVLQPLTGSLITTIARSYSDRYNVPVAPFQSLTVGGNGGNANLVVISIGNATSLYVLGGSVTVPTFSQIGTTLTGVSCQFAPFIFLGALVCQAPRRVLGLQLLWAGINPSLSSSWSITDQSIFEASLVSFSAQPNANPTANFSDFSFLLTVDPLNRLHMISVAPTPQTAVTLPAASGVSTVVIIAFAAIIVVIVGSACLAYACQRRAKSNKQRSATSGLDDYSLIS